MRVLATVLLLALLGGCLAPAAELDAGPTWLVADGQPAGELVRWSGATLDGGRGSFEGAAADWACWAQVGCPAAPVACADANCERRPFTLVEPGGAVVLSVRWPTDARASLDAWIEDAGGRPVALAPRAFISQIGLVARLEDAPAGDYVAVVAARAGKAAYEAAVRVEPPRADDAPRPLLPNLVTLPPTDLRLETPDYAGVSYFAFPVPGIRQAMEAAGTKGCRVDETAEYRAARCLRFSNAVANLGEGPLDVRLAAGGTSFVQRVHASDGGFEEHAGGAAEWHATHAHWHNAASNLFTVRPYDVATRALGEPLGEGKKGGICFADVGVVDVGLPLMRPAAQGGWGCFQPTADARAEWAMGITPGWYDLYAYLLSDQYVDLTGLDDGAYALCSVTNGEGTLLETDLADNEACTPFRLAGDAIELLEPAPYHAMRG